MAAPRTGATGMLQRSGQMRPGAELCPHDAARANTAILVHGFRRDMVLCQQCLQTFEELSRRARTYDIGPREVVARLLALGYTRTDAARFLLELIADRLGVPLGFRRLVLR